MLYQVIIYFKNFLKPILASFERSQMLYIVFESTMML